MRCTAILRSGARCSRQAEPGSQLCARHRSVHFRRQTRAFYLARLGVEDEEALPAAARLQGLEAEIPALRVMIRRALRANDLEAVRHGIETLGRALQIRQQLKAWAADDPDAALDALLDRLQAPAGGHQEGPSDPQSASNLSLAPVAGKPSPRSGPAEGTDVQGAPPAAPAHPTRRRPAQPTPANRAQHSLLSSPSAPEPHAADLVLRYQDGEPEVLDELYRLLQVTILAVLHHQLALQPPPTPSLEDLQHHSRAVLGQLAERWRPGVSFLGYFFRAFPRAIASHLTREPPATSVEQSAVSHQPSEVNPTALPSQHSAPSTQHSPTADGPFSEQDLASLPELQRQIVLLRDFEGQPMQAITRHVGLPLRTAHYLYQRAHGRLKGRARPPVDRSQVALRRLVQALHLAASPDGVLPNRRWAMAAAGLKRLEYDGLIARLVAAGAIYGRCKTKSGHLVERTPEATLARVAAALLP